MPFTSTRCACLTNLGLPWADSGTGGPTGYYAIGDYAWSVSYCTFCSASQTTQTSIGRLRAMGGSRGGAARRNAISAPLAADPTGDAGFGSGGPGRASSWSKHLKAPLAVDSEVSLASSGPEEECNPGTIASTSDMAELTISSCL